MRRGRPRKLSSHQHDELTSLVIREVARLNGTIVPDEFTLKCGDSLLVGRPEIVKQVQGRGKGGYSYAQAQRHVNSMSAYVPHGHCEPFVAKVMYQGFEHYATTVSSADNFGPLAQSFMPDWSEIGRRPCAPGKKRGRPRDTV